VENGSHETPLLLAVLALGSLLCAGAKIDVDRTGGSAAPGINLFRDVVSVDPRSVIA
jgi:hypothetical protein